MIPEYCITEHGNRTDPLTFIYLIKCFSLKDFLDISIKIYQFEMTSNFNN